MAVSVLMGRCGPCCSVAPMGSSRTACGSATALATSGAHGLVHGLQDDAAARGPVILQRKNEVLEGGGRRRQGIAGFWRGHARDVQGRVGAAVRGMNEVLDVLLGRQKLRVHALVIEAGAGHRRLDHLVDPTWMSIEDEDAV